MKPLLGTEATTHSLLLSSIVNSKHIFGIEAVALLVWTVRLKQKEIKQFEKGWSPVIGTGCAHGSCVRPHMLVAFQSARDCSHPSMEIHVLPHPGGLCISMDTTDIHGEDTSSWYRNAYLISIYLPTYLWRYGGRHRKSWMLSLV